MFDMFVVDLGNTRNVSKIVNQWPHAKVTRFYRSLLDLVLRCVEKTKTSHVWIVLGCSDVSKFDFEFVPVPWEAEQIHAWGIPGNKFGDILLVPVEQFKAQKPERLEWYHDINYHEPVARVPWPCVIYGSNDLTQTVLNANFQDEYILFTPSESISVDSEPALWGTKPYQLVSFCQDNSINLVPRQALPYLEKQVYDYPHLMRVNSHASKPQDIVFISYDEPQADENFEIIKNKFPQTKRVHGVEGMEHALRAAAEVSSTAWFFAVFAKTRLHEDWDFSFVPDRWQAPKQYIFNALNASNGLCYGHMGIILYHKESVLQSKAWEDIGGMDFTMSFDTESIPLLSVYGEFAVTPYQAWRTAFREVSKLCQWQLDEPSVETDYRIHVWRTHATGSNAEWVLRGANDGADFFYKNITNTDLLKQAFRWQWLKQYFVELYGEPDQLPVQFAKPD